MGLAGTTYGTSARIGYTTTKGRWGPGASHRDPRRSRKQRLRTPVMVVQERDVVPGYVSQVHPRPAEHDHMEPDEPRQDGPRRMFFEPGHQTASGNSNRADKTTIVPTIAAAYTSHLIISVPPSELLDEPFGIVDEFIEFVGQGDLDFLVDAGDHQLNRLRPDGQ